MGINLTDSILEPGFLEPVNDHQREGLLEKFSLLDGQSPNETECNNHDH